MGNNKIMRLQKYIAECGVASRRKAEEMIEAGYVKVNGHTAKIGDKVDPKKDLVTIKNKKIFREKNMRYIMLNKPRGYISTMSDEMDRRCVASLIADAKIRLFPVGRLDRESEGLMFFTNDGEFANKLSHPSSHVSKTYRVTTHKQITDEQINQISNGMMIDGSMTMPADVKIIIKEPERMVLEIILYEGRNRQIRKMFEQLQLDVARLKRVAIGSVKMGFLQPGKWRDLNEKEIYKLTKTYGK